MARPPRWRATLEAALSEACLAVRLYNDPVEPRAFEGFVVHMHMAWLYLLHAELTRDGVDFRVHDPQHPRRLLRIDGEVKTWGLIQCLDEKWPEGGAVRSNLDFFIRLRNRFEHRHTPGDAALALAMAGHAHAHLVNFEEELTQSFGPEWSMSAKLRFPVFIGTFTEEGETALRRLRQQLPKDFQVFLSEYHAGLAPEIANDSHFEFRIRIALELAPRHNPHVTAVQFTRFDDMTEEQRNAVEEMGRTGQVIVREQVRGVYGHGLLKPSQVVESVRRSVPGFHMGHFVKAWKLDAIRPSGTSKHPERTDERYCTYDSLNHNYGYTEAYVRHLSRRCSTDLDFMRAVGLGEDDHTPS